MLQLERQAGKLIRFLAPGGDSPLVREGLRGIESALGGLRQELAQLRETATALPRVHPAWARAKLDQREGLPRQSSVRAKTELAKHFEGELHIAVRAARHWGGLPGLAGGRLFGVTWPRISARRSPGLAGSGARVRAARQRPTRTLTPRRPLI